MPYMYLVVILSLFLTACGGGGGGGGSSPAPVTPTPTPEATPTATPAPDATPEPTGPPGDEGGNDDSGDGTDTDDANLGLEGRLYNSNGEFLDLKSGKSYLIAPQFGDSTTFPSRDGSEFVEIIEDYRFIPDDPKCLNFSIWKDLIAIRDANTGLIKDSFEVFEHTYGAARLSPDNQYVAFSWNDDEGCPSGTKEQISVFTREGELLHKVVDSVEDFDWLPDNRMVLTDGENIMVEQTALELNVLNYPIPTSAQGTANNVRVSPDGERVLFEMITDTNSLFSTVDFRDATVWEFNLNTLTFKQYITTRRDTDPQINTPIWSPDSKHIIATENYTGGVLSTITPGDFLVGWDGWRDLTIMPLEVSGVNYVFSAEEPSVVLPPNGDNSARPIFSIEDGQSRFLRMSPFRSQSWVPSPEEGVSVSAGSLPLTNTALNLGMAGSLYFADKNDSDQFIMKQFELATQSTTELFTISNDDADRFNARVYSSDDSEVFVLYDDRGLEDKLLIFVDRQGSVLDAWQMYNGDNYNLSPSSRIVFNPDRSLVAFAFEDENDEDKQKAVVFDWVSGDFKHVFAEQEFRSAEWLPNGNLLLFAVSGVYLSEVTDGEFAEPRLLFSLDKNLASHPDISPDGETLVFVLGHHLWTVNLDGSNLRQLTAMSDSFERYPTWSADGKYIVFQRHDDDSEFGDYWLIAADASAVPIWEEESVPQAWKVSEGAGEFLTVKYGPAYWR